MFSYSRRHLQEQEDTLKKLMENRQIQQMKELETLFEKYVKLQATIFFIQVAFIQNIIINMNATITFFFKFQGNENYERNSSQNIR